MIAPLSKRATAAVLCIGAVSLIEALPGPIRIAGSAVLLLYLPGLAFMSLLGGRVRASLDALFVPLLVSPAVTALLALAFTPVFGSLRPAMIAAAATAAVVVAASLFVPEKRNAPAPSPVPRSILFICAAFGGVVLVAYAVNHFLLFRIDAWYHVSIVNEIMHRGVPPRDPWFADEPIRYMWIFHFLIAGLGSVSGLSAHQAMGAFNVMNAFAFPYVVARMTALFRAERRFTLGGALFGIAGLGSVSWILWPVVLVRAFFGEVKGTAEVARIIHDVSIDGNQVVHFLAPYGLWMVNLIDKFYVITSFNYALNLLLLCFITIVSVDRGARRDARATAAVLVVTLGAILFHVIIGAALVVGIVGSAVILTLASLVDSRRSEPFPFFHALAAPGAALAAAAAAMPYIASLMGAKAGDQPSGFGLHIGITSALTIAAPLVILFPFTRAALREVRSSWDGAHRILAAWLAALVVLSLAVHLPARNDSKLIFPVFLLLTPLISWQIIDAMHRATKGRLIALLSLVCLLFAVPSILTVRGFFLEKPVRPIEVRRMGVTPTERDIFSWIEANTPRDAVILEGNTYCWMPVYAARRGFFPDEGTVSVLGYRGGRIDRCRRLRDDVFSASPLREEDRRFLLDLKRDVYVVVWEEDRARVPGLETRFAEKSEWFELVYRNPGGTVFRIVR